MTLIELKACEEAEDADENERIDGRDAIRMSMFGLERICEGRRKKGPSRPGKVESGSGRVKGKEGKVW
jgi:hypothetical protein